MIFREVEGQIKKGLNILHINTKNNNLNSRFSNLNESSIGQFFCTKKKKIFNLSSVLYYSIIIILQSQLAQFLKLFFFFFFFTKYYPTPYPISLVIPSVIIYCYWLSKGGGLIKDMIINEVLKKKRSFEIEAYYTR